MELHCGFPGLIKVYQERCHKNVFKHIGELARKKTTFAGPPNAEIKLIKRKKKNTDGPWAGMVTLWAERRLEGGWHSLWSGQCFSNPSCTWTCWGSCSGESSDSEGLGWGLGFCTSNALMLAQGPRLGRRTHRVFKWTFRLHMDLNKALSLIQIWNWVLKLMH